MDKGNEVFMTSNRKDDLKAAMAYCVKKFPNGFELIGDYSQRRQLELIAREMGIADKIVSPTQRKAQEIVKEAPREPTDYEKVESFIREIDSQSRKPNSNEIERARAMGLMQGLNLERVIDADDQRIGIFTNADATNYREAAVPINLDSGEVYMQQSTGDQEIINRIQAQVDKAFGRGPEQGRDDGRD